MDLQALGDLPFQTITAAMAYRLLGPTVAYLGGKTRELTEKAVSNIERIFANANSKLGDKLNSPGEVPPRVLRGIINEGAFCEDDIAAQYLGGVLASSRSEGRRDDRGVVMNALISRLSVYQLRTHYIVYHIIKDLFDGTCQPIPPEFRRQASASMPLTTYFLAMGFHNNELREIEKDESSFETIPGILEHTFFGLAKEGLIDSFEYHWKEKPMVSFTPSVLGVELFLWAYGMGGIAVHKFLDPEMQFELDESVILVPACAPLRIEDPSGEVAIVEGYTYTSYIGQSCPIRRETREGDDG